MAKLLSVLTYKMRVRICTCSSFGGCPTNGCTFRVDLGKEIFLAGSKTVRDGEENGLAWVIFDPLGVVKKEPKRLGLVKFTVLVLVKQVTG